MNNNNSTTALVVEVTHLDRVNRFGNNPTSFFTMAWDMARHQALDALAKRLTARGGLKSYRVIDEKGKVLLDVDS